MSDVVELKSVANQHQTKIIELLTQRLTEAAQGKMSCVVISWMQPGDTRLFVNHVGVVNTWEILGMMFAQMVSLTPTAPANLPIEQAPPPTEPPSPK